jgi:hypothetical protein
VKVKIEINKEKNQVKKMIPTCQLKAGHNYNRPITSFKHSENLQYLQRELISQNYIQKIRLLSFSTSHLSTQNLLSSYLGRYYVEAKTLSVVLQIIKVSPVKLWAEGG